MSETSKRITNPTTGGQKEAKLAQLFDAPPEALLELAKVYGYGADKYEHHNFRKGYNWSLSYNALLRHVLASIGGEDIDPESGRLHMAHAAWHALTLTQFYIDQVNADHPAELDDRYVQYAVQPKPVTCGACRTDKFGLDHFACVCNLPLGHGGAHHTSAGCEMGSDWTGQFDNDPDTVLVVFTTEEHNQVHAAATFAKNGFISHYHADDFGSAEYDRVMDNKAYYRPFETWR